MRSISLSLCGNVSGRYEPSRTGRSIRDPYEAYDYCLGKGQFLLVTGSMYLVGLIKKIERSPVIPYAPD